MKSVSDYGCVWQKLLVLVLMLVLVLVLVLMLVLVLKKIKKCSFFFVALFGKLAVIVD